MKSLFANSLDVMFDAEFDESKIKRTPKGEGGGQFASKGGGESGSGENKQEASKAEAAKPVAAVKIAPEVHQAIDAYKKIYPKTWQRFSSTMQHLGKIDGRIKEPESLQGKLEGRYKDIGLGGVTDILGMRCTSGKLSDVYAGAKEVEKQFKVVEFDDKMPKGQGFYRAVHLIVDSLDKTGNKRAEIQLRTVRQSNISDWGHDIAYKGKFAKHADVQAYAKAVSDASWELDNGRKAEYPAPPEILKKHGLEYDPERVYDSHWVAREKPEFL